MIKDMPVQGFLDELAGKAATPGGGGVAAVSGAMGAALISMVAHFTIGKKAYAAEEPAVKAILVKAEELRAELTNAIQEDVDAFDCVMEAYGMEKKTDEEKAARSAEIQTALKKTTDIPLK